MLTKLGQKRKDGMSLENLLRAFQYVDSGSYSDIIYYKTFDELTRPEEKRKNEKRKL